MRLTSLVVMLAVTPGVVMAQEAPEWSLSTGRTVGDGGNAIAGEIGWPGLEARFVHGISSHFDVGGRFGFFYGSFVGVNVAPALTFGGVLKAGLMRNGMLSLGLEFNPGIGFGFSGAGAFLIHFPFELQVGVTPSTIVNVVFGVRLVPTLVVGFDSSFGFQMPILFGPGVELFLARNFMVTLATRFGPGVSAGGQGAGVAFSFVATFGVGYRF